MREYWVIVHKASGFEIVADSQTRYVVDNALKQPETFKVRPINRRQYEKLKKLYIIPKKY